jgi:hypothetical protein
MGTPLASPARCPFAVGREDPSPRREHLFGGLFSGIAAIPLLDGAVDHQESATRYDVRERRLRAS